VLCKGLADVADLPVRSWQIVGEQPSVLPLDQRFRAKAIWRDFTLGHHHMGMDIAGIAFALLHVNGKVDSCAIAFGKILRKGTRQRQAIVAAQLMGKGDFELAGTARIAACRGAPAAFHSADRSSAQSASIPSGRTISRRSTPSFVVKSCTSPLHSFTSRLAMR
jgi:hypothetical protein